MRTNNEIMLEYFRLGNAGKVNYDVFCRFWHEMNDGLLQGAVLTDGQRADVLSGLAAFAEPEWFEVLPPPRVTSPSLAAV